MGVVTGVTFAFLSIRNIMHMKMKQIQISSSLKLTKKIKICCFSIKSVLSMLLIFVRSYTVEATLQTYNIT